MTEINEELIGKIYKELSLFVAHIVRYQAEGDRHAEHECKMAFAEIMARTVLLAVRDRYEIVAERITPKGTGLWDIEVDETYSFDPGDRLFILREKGKEEK